MTKYTGGLGYYGANVSGGKLFFRLLDGSSVSCDCIAEPYASQVVAACRAWNTAHVFTSAAKAIVDYDTREAAGEDMAGEIRPRMPGGSDF